jgi:hypothetical protein
MTGNLTVQTLVGINKAVNSSVGLSVGSDAASATSYGLEVCNNNSNTRFLVDGLGSQRFYGSDNAETARFTDGRLGIGQPVPTSLLEVKGANGAAGIRLTSPSGLGSALNITGSGYGEFYLYQAGANPKVGLQGNGTSYFLGGGITVGHSVAANIGGTPADLNYSEIGPGFIRVNRDDTADAAQLQFGKNGALHSYLETRTAGLGFVTDVGDFIFDGNMQINGSSTPLTTNRTASAGRGKHLTLKNNGSVVGSIGDYNGVPYIGYDTAGGGGIMFNGTAVEPMGLAGARQTKINDLGSTGFQWRNGNFSNTVTARSFERLWNSCDLTALDFDKFYPIGIDGGSASVMQTFELYKYYATANPTIGGAIQYGGVSMKMDHVGYTWGGNVIHNYLHHVASTYRCMIGAITLRGYYRPVIWLRGGYAYAWTSNNPNITATIYSTNTSFYGGSAYVYTIGPITDSVMQGKGGYLGTTHKYGIVAEDTSCNNWYT